MSGASVQRTSAGEPVPNATFDRGGVSPTRALARRHTGWMWLVDGKQPLEEQKCFNILELA